MNIHPIESMAKRFVLFNTMLISLVLLKSAGFMYPYYVLSVHGILIIGAILSVVLLKARSIHLMIFALALWFLTFILAMLKASEWPETVGLYVYDIIAIATVTALFEKKE